MATEVINTSAINLVEIKQGNKVLFDIIDEGGGGGPVTLEYTYIFNPVPSGASASDAGQIYRFNALWVYSDASTTEVGFTWSIDSGTSLTLVDAEEGLFSIAGSGTTVVVATLGEDFQSLAVGISI